MAWAMRLRRPLIFSATLFALLAVGASGTAQAPATRTFSVTARKYTFSPARIEVNQDDLVTIELRTEDIPHSWTVDEYRIAKRVNPGQPVTLEFRADRPGTFRYYCNLQIDEGCRNMQGELVVRPRR
jgi:cytochrome c oxidase subunit II